MDWKIAIETFLNIAGKIGTVILAMIACWAWLDLPNRFVKFVIFVVALAAGYLFSSRFNYDLGLMAASVLVVFAYVAIRLADKMTGQSRFYGKTAKKDRKPKYFRF
jgi:hypothetical protein